MIFFREKMDPAVAADLRGDITGPNGRNYHTDKATLPMLASAGERLGPLFLPSSLFLFSVPDASVVRGVLSRRKALPSPSRHSSLSPCPHRCMRPLSPAPPLL